MVSQSMVVGEAELFGSMVRRHARSAEGKATLRERSVIDRAFHSENQKLWQLADELWRLLPDGAWADRARVVREIESELGGASDGK